MARKMKKDDYLTRVVRVTQGKKSLLEQGIAEGQNLPRN